ncbi:histone-lysine N-methyltransferase SETMAR-like [Octopus bimaculoides]|uniref:histone-lysine N-methyltransferase SETMAR-like n=1 Tax=Octopus bimaculoides TaxID=37653 RepID=UPI0022DFBC13|nr:histone-lysine N-methyltransferase SETMAR-like [Octopus bimaculoides]
MDNQKFHIRVVMLFLFKKGENAAKTCKNICEVYGDDAVGESTVRRWFAKFKTGEFSLEDDSRSGRPSKLDEEVLKAKIEGNSNITTRELAKELEVSKSTAHEHLVKLGYNSRYNVWVPHKLSEKNCSDRYSVCDMLLKRNESTPFLKQLVTGDEKLIVYEKTVRKRSWSLHKDPSKQQLKTNIHTKKAMLCVWWDHKGIIYYELLPRNQAINSDVYCRQLAKLNQKIKELRPEIANTKGVVFQEDNARPHVSLATRTKLHELGWDLLPHPPYSPDIAPSSYHLFFSLQNSMQGKTFKDLDGVKMHLDNFFSSKPVKFYADGILKLPDRWAKVINNNGNYFIE